jgi:hypothetical protein
MKGLYFPAHTCNSHLLAMLRNVSKWEISRIGTSKTYHPLYSFPKTLDGTQKGGPPRGDIRADSDTKHLIRMGS